MKNILFTVYTEYQLILALNEIFVQKVYDTNKFNITLVIKHEKMHMRMDRPFNFAGLGIEILHFNDDLDIRKSLSLYSKEFISNILIKKWDYFILFQENDVLNCLLSFQLYKKGTEVRLYQDGLKAFNPMKSRSYGQLKIELQMRWWWMKNGYKADPVFNSINCYRYGFLKGVSKIFVTFPEKYINWNNKQIEKIEIQKSTQLFELIKQIFLLDDFILKENENVIFIISQSMRDDNTFEKMLIQDLTEKFPNRKIYLKSHPIKFTPYRDFINKLKSDTASKIEVIDGLVPAEFLIMQLNNSIVISTISTSMFLNNPSCTFYYTFEIAKPYMPRFNRFDTINPTSHVKSILSFKEIL